MQVMFTETRCKNGLVALPFRETFCVTSIGITLEQTTTHLLLVQPIAHEQEDLCVGGMRANTGIGRDAKSYCALRTVQVVCRVFRDRHRALG